MTAPTPAQLAGLIPLVETLGIVLTEATAERTVATLRWRPDLCTAGGLLHGGVLMSLADTAGAVCSYLNLPPGAGTATSESGTHFLRPVSGGTVTATSHPLHVGAHSVLVATVLADEEGRAVAHTTQRQAILPAR